MHMGLETPYAFVWGKASGGKRITAVSAGWFRRQFQLPVHDADNLHPRKGFRKGIQKGFQYYSP
jgi:hypothetical protein